MANFPHKAGLGTRLSLMLNKAKYMANMGTRMAAVTLQASAKPRDSPPNRASLAFSRSKNRQNMYRLEVKKKIKKASRMALLETQRMMGEVDHKAKASKP